MRDANLDAAAMTAAELASTEGYTLLMTLLLDNYLTATIPIKRMIERYAADALSSVNVPTRHEVTSLAERLTHIEMRLDDMDIQMDTLLRSVKQLVSNTEALREGQAAQQKQLEQAVTAMEDIRAMQTAASENLPVAVSRSQVPEATRSNPARSTAKEGVKAEDR